MLELRPNCECCDKDLPADADDAMICTFECTFCRSCADNRFNLVCPYMHDGSLKSLGQVIDHYQTQPSERVPAFTLSDEEREQLTAFLHDL